MKKTPIDIVCDVFRTEQSELGRDLDLRNLPGWDSLNHMTFIAALEREYDILLTGEEIAEMLDLRTVHAILQDRYGLEL